MNKGNLSIITGILFLLVLSFGSAELVTVGDGSSGSITVVPGPSGQIVVGPVYENPCGNGLIDYPEQCDGLNFAGQSCASLISGYTGTLVCSSTCTYDTSGCSLDTSTTTTTTTTTSSGGGGGGGGGGSSKTTSCLENWNCGEWSICRDGYSTRSCTDANACKTYLLKPIEARECTEEEIISQANDSGEGNGFFSRITGGIIGTLTTPTGIGMLILVILVMAGGTILIIRRYRKK